MKLPKIEIKYSTFFQKGTKSINDDFFITLITGYQGSGKTWFGVFDIVNKYKKRIVRTNIHSLKIPNVKIEYFTKIEEVYDDNDFQYVYLIDECAKKWNKDSRIDNKFYSWLQQSRKHSRYVYLIYQEYYNVPNWLRGVANTIYSTRKLSPFPLFVTCLGYPTLNTETKEWESDNFKYIVYKRTKKISSYYDTREPINSL